MTVLVIVDHNDPTALLVADAFADAGHQTELVDLRTHSVSFRTGGEPAVRIAARTVTPTHVLDRTAVTGHGLAAPRTLRRTAGTTWAERHTRAREEQGLLLAALDHLGRTSRVLNGVAARDLASMRNVVATRLIERGVRVAAEQPDDHVVHVVGGRIVMEPGHDRPSEGLRSACAAVAGTTSLDLIDVRYRGDVVTGWTPDLELAHLDRRTGSAMARSIVGTLVDPNHHSPVSRPSTPFIRDMVDHFGED